MTDTALERITRVETKLDDMKCSMDTFINNSDKKYASKITEKIVYGMVGAILFFIIALVLKDLIPSAQAISFLP